MKGAWYEVWGTEPGEPEAILLHKFPGHQWSESLREEVEKSLAARGVTSVEILRVDEE